MVSNQEGQLTGWRLTWRQSVLVGLSSGLTILLLLLGSIAVSQPPASAQLTFIGTTDALQLLAEGAGGGRVVIGGGERSSELVAALGQQFVPWQTTIDQLILLERRDIPGATELVRRGQVRAVLIVGVADDRAALPGLAALWDACAARQIPYRVLVVPERLTLGRTGDLLIDLRPGDETTPPLVQLRLGAFPIAVVNGPHTVPAPIVVVPHPNQEQLQAVALRPASLTLLPVLRAAPGAAGQQIILAPGEQVTLAVAGASLAVRSRTR